MGFKRTTEGRVYFKGDDDAPAAKPIDYRALTQNGTAQPASSLPSAAQAQATQFQILSLLKSLNDKLKISQTDRARMQSELDAYRKVIEDLAGKAAKGEKIYQDLEQKILREGKGAGGKADRAEKLAEDTLKEMKETRKLLLELEDKTDKADKGVMTLQRQLGQTRALGDQILKKQAEYDEVAKRLDETEKAQEELTRKLEETASQQSRMLRQIEKVAEDRARFMRKIERIEETVIQTRDALSAKAMVLLTDQGEGEAKPLIGAARSVPEQLRTSSPRSAGVEVEAWRKPALQAAGVIAILTLGIAAGWMFSAFRAPQNAIPETKISEAPAPETYELAEENTPEDSVIADIERQEDSGQFAEATGPFAPTETNPPQAAEAEETLPVETAAAEIAEKKTPATLTKSNVDDIGSVDINDTKKLEEMLSKDPDALAAMLNEIEPGTASAPEEEPKVAENAAAAASLKSEEPPAREQAPGDLKKSMRPDSSLPDTAKQIEAQAYQGVPEAQHDLAAIYTAGHGGVKQDYKRAAFWFRQAADQGVANARYNLGVLYHQGLGVKQDIKQAIKWYEAAADRGHPEAQYNLGIAYIEGIGVQYDAAKAADNFEKAAKQGITEAAYNLGLIYENGLLGRPKPDQALTWYKTAADNGSPEAKEALNELAKNLSIKVEDVNRVAESVKTASNADGRVLTAQVQEYLMKAGLFPGPADGSNSAITSDAIRSYQAAHHLRADGKVSEDLLRHMLSNEQ